MPSSEGYFRRYASMPIGLLLQGTRESRARKSKQINNTFSRSMEPRNGKWWYTIYGRVSIFPECIRRRNRVWHYIRTWFQEWAFPGRGRWNWPAVLRPPRRSSMIHNLTQLQVRAPLPNLEGRKKKNTVWPGRKIVSEWFILLAAVFLARRPAGGLRPTICARQNVLVKSTDYKYEPSTRPAVLFCEHQLLICDKESPKVASLSFRDSSELQNFNLKFLFYC